MTVASLAASEHFQNHCLSPTVESKQYWEKQLLQNPEYSEIYEEAKTLVLSLNTQLTEAEVEEAFLNFKEVVEEKQRAKPTKLVAFPQKKKANIKRNYWLTAATILLLISVGIWQLFLTNKATTIQLATNYGEVKTHVLPDGSKVILNANSILKFSDQWPKGEPRTLQLLGEAFFEVKKKGISEKFTVATEKGKVEVLGTSFNVKQRAEALEVALLEGAVALSVPKYPTIKMEPGELVRIAGTTFFDRQKADVDAFSAWRFQRMVFKEMEIEKVIQRLQEEFNWTVKVANQALLKRKITATIPKNDPELLLQALSEIYELDIKRLNKQTYLIK